MARNYLSRISRDADGRRLYGRGLRLARENVAGLPTAVLAASATEVNTATAVEFDDSQSVASGIGKLPDTYTYDFGDGSDIHTGRDPAHTFDTAGEYQVVLTITNSLGETSSDSLTVTVEAA